MKRTGLIPKEEFGTRLYQTQVFDLLAILFERLINICMDGFGVDPSKSYTSAGFFWEAMLRKTGVKLELLTDPEKYAFFAIRGGISVVSNRFADANDKYLSSYDSSEPSSYKMEWDANSIYGSEMLEPLPVGDFKNVREE